MNTMLCFFTCKYFLKPIFDDIGGERGGTGMEAAGGQTGERLEGGNMRANLWTNLVLV